MAEEDEGYDAFLASDEDANYDEFMMSEEEGAGMIEMEEESNEEADGSDSGATNAGDSVDLAALQNSYESALSFAEDQEFDRARELLVGLYRRSDDLGWKWKSLVQILRMWVSEVYYNGVDEDQKIQDDFSTLVGFLRDNHSEIDGALLRESLKELLDELFPFLSRELLFATELIAVSHIESTMQLRLNCIAQLQTFLEGERVPWAKELRNSLEFKRLTAKIWKDRLTLGSIDLHDLHALEVQCETISLDDATNDPEYTDRLSLILQCHIFCFMAWPGDISESRLLVFVETLEQLSSKSLSISQSLGLMLQLNTARAILLLLAEANDETREELPLVRDVSSLRERFWKCLQHMEEIGGSQKDFSSLFEKFILSGFILCSMILYRAERTKINPFDLEQIKIAQDSPCVAQLQTVYRNFVNSDLPGLYASIQQLEAVKSLLSGLIQNVYYLARLIKLWTQIAPVYSCISLKDLQQMLQLDEATLFTRDDLLTVLMRSIMKGTAKIFYKLDLTRDLVFFGDEYKLQLGTHSKESFAKDSFGKNSKNLEWANNVGIFNDPARLRIPDTCAFFEKLQRSRDTIQSSPNVGFQPANMRYSDKYDELAQLATKALSRGR